MTLLKTYRRLLRIAENFVEHTDDPPIRDSLKRAVRRQFRKTRTDGAASHHILNAHASAIGLRMAMNTSETLFRPLVYSFAMGFGNSTYKTQVADIFLCVARNHVDELISSDRLAQLRSLPRRRAATGSAKGVAFTPLDQHFLEHSRSFLDNQEVEDHGLLLDKEESER
eukprot:gnl/Spiro4/18285_TR9773_c0_g1_i1.p1 gnl/Spiro4/18285_TR9773_c0_g1~~gnl/Spiro4/18285_TR9773_c0_g1_i1.p1  ORF type:complete len:169 (-),score=19.72 gnl/Spiro4/18285_TR9773_c0_g1_i1:60-566(-)